MRWPPNQAWTSTFKREGYRHFEVKQYGGKKEQRWVELFPVNNKEILIQVSWDELKDHQCLLENKQLLSNKIMMVAEVA